ncbi:MAG: host-nuclease inhibitor Gam family protein [Bacteroidales bacterium]|nr:host-nuclease inhibitor Gam family protein [Bacteroidales bacterium]
MSEARKLEMEEEEDLQEVAILDDASAEYMLKRIREANAQYERMEAWYAMQLEKAKKIRDNTVAWAEGNLRAYFDMVPTKNTKTQRSYELPGGKLVLKNQEPEFEKADEAAVVGWLKKNKMNDMIKVKETANWDEMKKAMKVQVNGETVCTEDGEVIPGMKATIREPKFTVTVK